MESVLPHRELERLATALDGPVAAELTTTLRQVAEELRAVRVALEGRGGSRRVTDA